MSYDGWHAKRDYSATADDSQVKSIVKGTWVDENITCVDDMMISKLYFMIEIELEFICKLPAAFLKTPFYIKFVLFRYEFSVYIFPKNKNVVVNYE